MFQTHFVCSMPQPYNMSFIQGAMVSLLKNDTKTQNLDIVGLLVTIDWFLNVEAIFHFCNKRFLSVRILSYISKSEGLLLFLRTGLVLIHHEHQLLVGAHDEYWAMILFSYAIFFWIWYQVNAVLTKWVAGIPSFLTTEVCIKYDILYTLKYFCGSHQRKIWA